MHKIATLSSFSLAGMALIFTQTLSAPALAQHDNHAAASAAASNMAPHGHEHGSGKGEGKGQGGGAGAGNHDGHSGSGSTGPGSTGPAAHGAGAHGGATDHKSAGGHAAKGHGEHAEHGEEHGPEPINWASFADTKKSVPYVGSLMNLALLAFLLVRFGKKPVTEGLKKRKDDIAKDIEEAARMKKEAEARAEKYQSSLKNLDKDLATTRSTLEEAGKSERSKLVKEAEEKAARMRKDADFLLEQEGKQKKLDLMQQAIENASTQANALLASSVTQDDHLRLCEEFLVDLGNKPAVAGGAQ
jgi:F-type H+-transporting ATPase subunit b